MMSTRLWEGHATEDWFVVHDQLDGSLFLHDYGDDSELRLYPDRFVRYNWARDLTIETLPAALDENFSLITAVLSSHLMVDSVGRKFLLLLGRSVAYDYPRMVRIELEPLKLTLGMWLPTSKYPHSQFLKVSANGRWISGVDLGEEAWRVALDPRTLSGKLERWQDNERKFQVEPVFVDNAGSALYLVSLARTNASMPSMRHFCWWPVGMKQRHVELPEELRTLGRNTSFVDSPSSFHFVDGVLMGRGALVFVDVLAPEKSPFDVVGFDLYEFRDGKFRGPFCRVPNADDLLQKLSFVDSHNSVLLHLLLGGHLSDCLPTKDLGSWNALQAGRPIRRTALLRWNENFTRCWMVERKQRWQLSITHRSDETLTKLVAKFLAGYGVAPPEETLPKELNQAIELYSGDRSPEARKQRQMCNMMAQWGLLDQGNRVRCSVLNTLSGDIFYRWSLCEKAYHPEQATRKGQICEGCLSFCCFSCLNRRPPTKAADKKLYTGCGSFRLVTPTIYTCFSCTRTFCGSCQPRAVHCSDEKGSDGCGQWFCPTDGCFPGVIYWLATGHTSPSCPNQEDHQ